MRTCGECTVCCTVGGVPALNKEPHERCQYENGKCSLFGKPERPAVCSSYRCSWLYGHGGEEDRPDKIGVLFSINATKNGNIHFAIETERHALITSAKSMLRECAEKIPLPIIAVKYGVRPPEDKGDWIIVPDNLALFWSRNIGNLLHKIGGSVKMYELLRDG
jgi:hypothetical protein